MAIWLGDKNPAVPASGTTIVIGNFDGVHRGHQYLLAEAAKYRAPGQDLVAVTFEPHPLHVLRPQAAPKLLTNISDRLDLLAQSPADHVYLLEFTKDFAQIGPEEFVRDYLVQRLNMKQIVVGAEVRFGRANSGTLETLNELSTRYDFTVHVLENLPVDRSSERISSSLIRRLIEAGDLPQAADLLGRYYALRGAVIHGDARGRQIGFPTANLGGLGPACIPDQGVYAGYLSSPVMQRLPAAISVGTNPTFAGQELRVEAYVLDRDDLYLYGQQVKLEFVARIRPTLKFDMVADLVQQMQDDVVATKTLLELQ